MGRHLLCLCVALLLPFLGWSQALPSGAPVNPKPKAAPVPAGTPAAEAQGTMRYRIENGKEVLHGLTALDVQVKLDRAGAGQIRFVCDIRTERVMLEARVVALIRDAKGEVVHETGQDLSVQPGLTQCEFTWDVTSLPIGSYWARFTVADRVSPESASRELIVTKMADLPLADKIAKASADVADLKQYVEDTLRDEAGPYTRMRLRLAEEFAVRARQSFSHDELQRADYYADYVLDTVDSVRVRLAFSKELPELSSPIPAVDLRQLSGGDGAFHVGPRPVFLFGGRGGEELMRDLPALKALGLNLAAFDLTPGDVIPSETPPDVALGSLVSALDVADELNISVTGLLSPFELTEWAVKRWPNIRGPKDSPADINVVTPAAREYIAQYLRAAARTLQGRPMLNGVALAQNPAFQFDGPGIRKGFLAHVRESYPDVEEVNRVWKARFRNWGELNLIWDPGRYDYSRRVGYQYDWQAYHQWLGTEFFRWMDGIFTGSAPGIPTFVQVSENVLEPGETNLGIDREGIAALMDLSGCAVSNSPESGTYAMGYPDASMMYTLLRSFAPEKPVYNTRHVLIADDYPYGSGLGSYVYTALVEGAMSGLNASALSVWGRSADQNGLSGSILDRPDCLEAYATAGLDLNRLAEIVTAFQQAPADVAILWSMPSKIYENGDPYLASVKRAYEGCSFGGRKIRFLTEDQILRGGLSGVNVLVLADAPALGSEIVSRDSKPEDDRTFQLVNAYVEGGGVVIRTGNPVPFTARGTSRQDMLRPTPHTILVRGNDTSTGYLDAMDAVYSMGTVDPVPRAINEYGYPLEGVKTQYVEFAGKSYLYVLNLRKEPVRCALDGVRKAGRDILRGRSVVFPASLQPLDPMIVELAEVPSEEAMPVAEIGKEPEQPERVSRKSAPRGAPRRK